MLSGCRLLLMVAIVIGHSVNIVVHKALALEEVLSPLLLLNLLLTLVKRESLLFALGFLNITLFQLLDELNQLIEEVNRVCKGALTC